eukprot:gene21910-26864_t
MYARSSLNGTRPKRRPTSKSTRFLLKKPNPFFYDELAVQFFDEDHSSVEERFLMLGMSSQARLLIQPLANALFTQEADMKAEYDLSKLPSRKNPYASKLKKSVTMRLSEDVVVYFKGMAEEAGMPYQSLINLYLRDCLANHRKIQIKWPQSV